MMVSNYWQVYIPSTPQDWHHCSTMAFTTNVCKQVIVHREWVNVVMESELHGGCQGIHGEFIFMNFLTMLKPQKLIPPDYNYVICNYLM